MDDALDLWVLQTGAKTECVVCARCRHDLAIARVPLDSPAFMDLVASAKSIRRALRGEADYPTSGELREFGCQLYHFLFPEPLAVIYERPGVHEFVRLHIVTNEPRIKELPWEYLQTPAAPGGPNSYRPVVRVVPTVAYSPHPPAAETDGPLRALFVVAEPLDQTAITWQVVLRTFQQTLEPRFTVDVLPHATPESLQTALNDKEYHLFHFSGHGAVSDGSSVLVLENGELDRRSAFLSADDLGIMLSAQPIRLAVLAACSTAEGKASDDFSVMAERLVRGYVPAVVANQAAVPDAFAAAFARAFYETLMREQRFGDVDHAVEAARRRLAAIPVGAGRGKLSWGIPTLYRHISSAQVFRR